MRAVIAALKVAPMRIERTSARCVSRSTRISQQRSTVGRVSYIEDVISNRLGMSRRGEMKLLPRVITSRSAKGVNLSRRSYFFCLKIHFAERNNVADEEYALRYYTRNFHIRCNISSAFYQRVSLKEILLLKRKLLTKESIHAYRLINLVHH